MSDDLIRHALSLIAAAARIGEVAKKHKYHGHDLDVEGLLAALAMVEWEMG